MRQFLVFVDHDCDGITSDLWRVNLPVGLEDANAVKKAIELGQMPSVSDPSEWFTLPRHLHHHADALFAAHRANRSESIRHYAHTKGNIFDS